jgi:hypothetical protein
VIRDGELAVSAAVMAHPDREKAARRLVERHPELGLRVALDPEPGRPHSLSAALAAWSMVEPGASHHLVIQDDVVLCENFAERLSAAVRARPHAAVSLFAEWGSRSADLARLALLRGQRYAAVADPYTPTQALVLPAPKAVEFVRRARKETEPDDIAMYRYLRSSATPSVVTAANLVQHEDWPSLTGNGFQGPRLSVCFVPGADSADLLPTVAGAELDYVPHVSWMRLLGEWFYCGPEGDLDWSGHALTQRFPSALDLSWVRTRYAEQIERTDQHASLRAALSDTVLFEVWLSCFALGLISGVEPAEVDARGCDPLWRAALGTVFPGAFRRYLPAAALDRLGPVSAELFGLAVRTGAEAAASLDRRAVSAVAGRA